MVATSETSYLLSYKPRPILEVCCKKKDYLFKGKFFPFKVYLQWQSRQYFWQSCLHCKSTHSPYNTMQANMMKMEQYFCLHSKQNLLINKQLCCSQTKIKII